MTSTYPRTPTPATVARAERGDTTAAEMVGGGLMDEERTQLVETILAISNVTRKCVLIGDEKITKVIKESLFDEHELNYLLQFAELFMQGAEKDMLIDEFQLSPELVKKFDKYKLAW